MCLPLPLVTNTWMSTHFRLCNHAWASTLCLIGGWLEHSWFCVWVSTDSVFDQGIAASTVLTSPGVASRWASGDSVWVSADQGLAYCNSTHLIRCGKQVSIRWQCVDVSRSGVGLLQQHSPHQVWQAGEHQVTVCGCQQIRGWPTATALTSSGVASRWASGDTVWVSADQGLAYCNSTHLIRCGKQVSIRWHCVGVSSLRVWSGDGLLLGTQLEGPADAQRNHLRMMGVKRHPWVHAHPLLLTETSWTEVMHDTWAI